MDQQQKKWYGLTKHNFATLDPATTKVMGSVRGLERAQQMADALDKRLPPEEREAGFQVFWEEGCKPARLDLRRTRPRRDARRSRR